MVNNVKSLKILYLTEFLTAIGGGGEVAFFEIAEGIASRGHSVHTLCYDTDDPDRKIGVKTGDQDRVLMNFHRIKPKIKLAHGHFASVLQQGRYVLNALIRGSQLIRESEIDIIHANTLCPAIAGTILGILFDKPVIVTVHHVYSIRDREYRVIKKYSKIKCVKHWFSSLPKWVCEKIIVRLPVDVIHTVSESAKADLVRFGTKRMISVIPNGIDYVKYGSSPACSAERLDNLLFIGRLVEYKNLDVVISAFRIVADKRPLARLVIVGDGPARKEWDSLAQSLGISDRVTFAGYVTNEMKLQFLQECSVLVFPSLIEGFGLAILEGFASGKPVLVSDIAPSNRIVRNGIEGFILPPLAADKWASMILFLLENDEVRMAIGSNCRIRALANFDIGSIVDQFEELYDSAFCNHKVGSSTKGQARGWFTLAPPQTECQ